MDIKVTIEGKKSIKDIQLEFSDKLSEKEILKTTAFAVNEVARRAIRKSISGITKTYTVDKKYKDRMAYLTKPASGTQSGLYAMIYYNYKPIPMIAFKNRAIKPKKGAKPSKGGGVVVQIIRGKKQTLKHAFIATMRSGHTGIYGVGSYKNGQFVHAKEYTGSGKSRITEYKTASPFTMGRNKNLQSSMVADVKEQLPKRTKALLEVKANKIKT